MKTLPYQIIKLDNGLTVILEQVPYVKSVALGLLVGVGSVNDPQDCQGMAHLVEHMLFKGTVNRSAKDIAQEIDIIGGRISAYTTKEYTKIYSVVLNNYCNIALDILSDIYQNSLIDPKELEKEKGVIFEEISLYEDTPDEIIHDNFIKNILPGHPLGQAILGKKDDLLRIARKDILDFISQYYVPNNTILTVVGDFAKDDLLLQIKNKFSKIKSNLLSRSQHILPDYFGGINIDKKATEQVHLCLGSRGVSFQDKHRYTLSLLSAILGDSMSSRLFQNIREDRGLVYSIFSFPTFFSNAGIFSIYAGTNEQNANQVIDLILNELQLLKSDLVSLSELDNAKQHLKGNIILSLESTESKMSWLSRAYYYYQEIKQIESIFLEIDRVNLIDIQQLANILFDNLQLTAIGSLKRKKIKE